MERRRQRSDGITSHAGAIQVPAELTDEPAHAGLKIYRDTCVYCHGPPGQDPGDIGMGLNPKAPKLPDGTRGLSTAELFWVIKNASG